MSRIIPMEEWGKDHWSMLLYIETRVVDHRGFVPHDNKLRLNGVRYPTRLRDGEEKDHDDLDVMLDLDEAELTRGFMRSHVGQGDNIKLGYQVSLTERGWQLAHALRRLKAKGLGWKDLLPITKEVTHG